MIQYVLSFVRRHVAHRLGRLNRSGDRTINRCGVGQCDFRRNLSRVLVRYDQVLIHSDGFIR